MLERIRKNLETRCMLSGDKPILVAVSGGPDSLFLLDSLYRLDFSLIVAHYNHGLRQESAYEAETVRKIAEKRGLPYTSAQGNVRKFAKDNRLSQEEAARISRYRFLFQEAESHCAQAVAVGHTADDQVETVLMHMLRGAGLSGLKGMTYRSLPNTWSRDIPLVRPLLDVWREEILAYLVENDLCPCMDASNLDTRYYRNRLRRELIPYMESIQPALRKNLCRTAEILGEDLAVLENLVDITWSKCVLEEGPDYLSFSPGNLQQQPLGLQRHLFRRGIDRLRPGLRDVGFEVIERAVWFLNKPSHQGRMDLVAGLFLEYENSEDFIQKRDISNISNNERLWIATSEANLPNEWPQLPHVEECSLDIPGEVKLRGGWRIVAETVEKSERVQTTALSNPDPLQAWLDLDSLQRPLIIRTRLPGDRFHPLGMKGRTVKVADLMVNIKLPRRARDRWPLLISGGEVAWVPGTQVGHKFQITERTERILRIRITRYY